MNIVTCFRGAAAAAAVALTVAVSVPVQAAVLAEQDYAHVNAALVRGYVLPRVAALAETTKTLAGAMPVFCAMPRGDRLDGVVRAFTAANDAWMRVRHLAFGPMELFMRANRFQFSPDPGGRVASDLAAAVAKRDEALLAPDDFSHAPVTIQGLSALEHLLFGNEARAALLSDDADAAYRCRLASVIARNVADMAAGVRADWTGGDTGTPFVDLVAHPGGDNPYYQTHLDATLQFFKSFYGGLQVIVDIKLLPPLGASLAAARPHLVESELSGASISNIVASLESLAALYSGPDGKHGLESLLVRSGADKPLEPLLRRAFDITLGTARSIDMPLARAVADPKARPKVEKLLLQVRALKQLVSKRLAEALGLAIGFNALDGD